VKAVILAGGRGTRMLPITVHLPKPLIPVGGRPFLSYVLERLHDAGIDEFGIVVCYKKEMIADFMAKTSCKYELIDQGIPKGTGHAVLKAESFVNGEPFLVVSGDNLYCVRDLQKIAGADAFAIGGVRVEHPEKYGVLDVKDGFLSGIVEKPLRPKSSLVNAGIYRALPSLFQELRTLTPHENGEIYLTDAFQMAKKVRVIELSKWHDLGCPEDIPLLEKELKKEN
jgi:dTDP-glucose pyrophosphorylase